MRKMAPINHLRKGAVCPNIKGFLCALYIEGTECGVSNVYGLWGPPAPFILEPIKIKVGGLFKKCIFKKEIENKLAQ